MSRSKRLASRSGWALRADRLRPPLPVPDHNHLADLKTPHVRDTQSSPTFVTRHAALGATRLRQTPTSGIVKLLLPPRQSRGASFGSSSQRADVLRAACESAYRFMSAMAGDEPGFEEAARALFHGNIEAASQHMAPWPADVRKHAVRLLEATRIEPPAANHAAPPRH